MRVSDEIWEKAKELINDCHHCGYNQSVDCPKDYHRSEFESLINQVLEEKAREIASLPTMAEFETLGMLGPPINAQAVITHKAIGRDAVLSILNSGG